MGFTCLSKPAGKISFCWIARARIVECLNVSILSDSHLIVQHTLRVAGRTKLNRINGFTRKHTHVYIHIRTDSVWLPANLNSQSKFVVHIHVLFFCSHPSTLHFVIKLSLSLSLSVWPHNPGTQFCYKL